MNDTIPTDMMQDAHGRWVPKELIRTIDLIRDKTVRDLVDEARILSGCLATSRERLFAEFQSFVDLSAEQYGVSRGGDKGNITLLSFDGKLKVIRSVQDHILFDERLQAAKRLIDECVREWSADSNANVRVLVEHAFQTDKAGKVNTERVIGLRKLNIDDPRWQSAMKAIGDAIQVTHSTTYLRFYERIGETQAWRPIPLDLTNARPLEPETSTP